MRPRPVAQIWLVTGQVVAIRRCFALGSDCSTLPEGLTRYLASAGTAPIEIGNDLLYDDAVLLQCRRG